MNSILNVNWVSKVKARESYFCSVRGMASKVMECQTHGIASSLIQKLGVVGLNLGYTRVSLKGKKKKQCRPINLHSWYRAQALAGLKLFRRFQ